MPKRKRRSDSESSYTKFQKFGYHPEDKEQASLQDIHEGEAEDPVFATFLSFVELSKQKSTDESKSKINEAAKELLSFLPPAASDFDNIGESRNRLENSILSAADLVTLLLPWSVKVILWISSSNSDNDDESETLWQTLKTCLEFVVVQQQQLLDKTGVSSREGAVIKVSDILTLGILHKLVPVAIKIALGDNDKNTSKATAATCYCILVDQYYMPPFDTVCDSLLPLFDRDSKSDDGMHDDEHDEAMFQATLVSTLRLLVKRMDKANPKKSFQKLISPEVFGVLAKIYNSRGENWHHDPRPVIEDLLLSGLFHLEHHIDGFRSITMKFPSASPSKSDPMEIEEDKKETKSFHCYQEGLLPMISKGLSESKSPEEIAAYVGILPVLLKCFIQQTLVLRDQLNEKATAKKKAADSHKIVQLQFRFFSALSAQLTNLLEKQGTEGEAIDRADVYLSMEQNLRHLLVNDVYLPTMDDKKEVHFKFLANLASSVMKNFTARNKSQSGIVENSERKHALSCLNILVQLNHLVLHDSLPQVLSDCVANVKSSNDAGVQREAAKFVTTLIATYKKLRQLDYFVSSFVDAVGLLEKDQRVESLQALNLMIADSKVKSTLADSILSSPVNQIKDIFAKLNDWIVSHSGSGKGSWSQESSDAVVGLLLLLLQNVRIDMNTAIEIYPLCEAVINGAVQSSIHYDGQMNSPKSRNGLKLFGHAVALLNKCDFWIDKSSDKAGEEAIRYEIPKKLLLLLDEAADRMEVEQSVRQELLFLACQIVERLHGQIQDMQQVMFASDEQEFSNEKLVATAKKFARFALRLSASDLTDEIALTRQASKALAESISSWGPYVEKDEMETFLSNFFFCQLLEDNSKDDQSICVKVLGDSEFFEAKHVAESLGCALVSCAAKLTREALDPSFKVKKFSREYLTCPISDSSWDGASAKELNSILTTNGNSGTGNEIEDGIVLLKAASTCLGMLKILPVSIWTEKYSCIDALDLIIRLDLVYRSISEKSVSCQSIVIDILTSLREISALVLESLCYNFPETVIGDSCTLRNYMQCLASSSHELMISAEGKEESYLSIVNSSKRSFCAIAKNAIAQSDSLENLAKGLDSILAEASKDHHKKLCTAVLCCAITREIDTARKSTAAAKRIATSIFKISLRDFLPIAISGQSANVTLKNESTRLIGELLKIGPELVGTEGKKRMADDVQKAATKALETKQVDGGFDYLIGCLALSKPAKSTRVSLANGIIQLESTTNHVLETAFSELVVDLDSGSLEGLLEDLASFPAGGQSASFRLKLFQLLLVKLAPTKSLPIVAEYSRRFFHMSLQCMVKKKNVTSDFFGRMVHNAVSLITEMASNRDVISFRESDIALILCHISSAMKTLDEQLAEVTTSIYNSCCSMLMFLLQRFPKQLHSCVSITSVVLVALLQRALYDDCSEHDAKMRCQKYTRLCELLQPHGDVYKKHVLSILLEFVKAIRNNLDATRKNEIMPAIFCLLDILQQYENSQLNCMLDDMGRALLRSVHTNYQRAHVYKGQ